MGDDRSKKAFNPPPRPPELERQDPVRPEKKEKKEAPAIDPALTLLESLHVAKQRRRTEPAAEAAPQVPDKPARRKRWLWIAVTGVFAMALIWGAIKLRSESASAPSVTQADRQQERLPERANEATRLAPVAPAMPRPAVDSRTSPPSEFRHDLRREPERPQAEAPNRAEVRDTRDEEQREVTPYEQPDTRAADEVPPAPVPPPGEAPPHPEPAADAFQQHAPTGVDDSAPLEPAPSF